MKIKKTFSAILPVGVILLFLLAGIAIVLYPLVSNYLYEKDQSLVKTDYEETTGSLEDEEKLAMLSQAQTYNEALRRANIVLTDPFDPELLQEEGSGPYQQILNCYEEGIMAYLEIPLINVYLPVYHGTSSAVLEKGVGHLEQTSLPVGGEDTHCVLTGHTGLAGKKLLTDLSSLEEGDVFYIHILGDTLSYQVEKEEIVEPEDTKSLNIEEGRDMVTLVTCYPYGVNSHRLLVHGTRIPNEEAEVIRQKQERETESQWEKEYKKGVLLCLSIYIPLIIAAFFLIRRRRRSNG